MTSSEDQLTSRSCFRNLLLSNNAQLSTGQTTSYVTMPGVIHDILSLQGEQTLPTGPAGRRQGEVHLPNGRWRRVVIGPDHSNEWDHVPVYLVECLSNPQYEQKEAKLWTESRGMSQFPSSSVGVAVKGAVLYGRGKNSGEEMPARSCGWSRDAGEEIMCSGMYSRHIRKACCCSIRGTPYTYTRIRSFGG